MNKINLAERVRGIAEKAVKSLALELVHVEIIGSGKNRTVRVYIDKEAGITHEDCSTVSHQIEQVLDTKDIIAEAYTLEVSSPGIERGLYSLKDFEKFKDSLAKVKTDAAINGQRNFRGTIVGTQGEEVVFDDKTNGTVNIPFSLIRKANLEFDIEKELKQAKKRKSSKK